MYKNNRIPILIPLIVAGSLFIGIMLGGVIFQKYNPAQKRFSRKIVPGTEKLNLLLSLIDQKYVDRVDMDSLAERMIPLMLEDLDPHSTYIPAKDLASRNESLEGSFEGIGIMFSMITDTVRVTGVIPSGPSDRAGILMGDRVISINGKNVAGVKFGQDSIMSSLRGPKGSDVELGIQRIGISELVPITVTRDVIPINSVTSTYMIRPGIGYVSFGQFSRNAFSEVVNSIAALKSEGAKKLIFDLRGNPGGWMEAAVAISNQFLPKGELIVFTRDRKGNESKQYSDGTGLFQDMEMVILIDQYSASSSEIVAGAIQDNDRGFIIGRRSFGKGLVQEPLYFSDGSAVNLTIARYYTPSGRNIQKPYDDYDHELQDRYDHSEMFSADSIRFTDTTAYWTLSGRMVKGGGGITPDYFVPVDTTYYTPYFREVIGRNFLLKFAMDYSDRNIDRLNKIISFEDLEAFFARDPGLLSKFVEYARKEGVEPDAKQIAVSQKMMLAYLKAYIAQSSPLEENAFSYFIQDMDADVQKALEVLGAEIN